MEHISFWSMLMVHTMKKNTESLSEVSRARPPQLSLPNASSHGAKMQETNNFFCCSILRTSVG